MNKLKFLLVAAFILIADLSQMYGQSRGDSSRVKNANRTYKIHTPKFTLDTTPQRLQLEINDLRDLAIKNQREADVDIEKLKIETDRQYTHLGFQIDFATWCLGVFTFAITIAAIGLGLYVSSVYKKIESASQSQKLHMENAERAEKKAEELYNLMVNDVHQLYAKIKKTETDYIFARLERVPEDISNFVSELFSRDLEEEYFEKLSSITMDLIARGRRKDTERACMLLFQHFPYQAMYDGKLRPQFLKKMARAIRGSNLLDLRKAIPLILRAMNEKGISFHKAELRDMFKALSSSRYKDKSELYNSMTSSINNVDKWREIFEAIKPYSENITPKFKVHLIHEILKLDPESEFFLAEKAMAEKDLHDVETATAAAADNDDADDHDDDDDDNNDHAEPTE